MNSECENHVIEEVGGGGGEGGGGKISVGLTQVKKMAKETSPTSP